VKASATQLSRRERQIMDVIYKLGKASANEVLGNLPDPPSYSAVRALLRILEDKGFLTHEQEGAKYVYLPTTALDTARRSALRNLVSTFFDGSTEDAVATLLSLDERKLSKKELDRLSTIIKEARSEGR
jgi:predicted transcriptional regulator